MFFGHRAFMMKGCYIDGDPQNGAGGGIADPEDTGDSGLSTDSEGQPDGNDSDDPDQKRTSKQPPEVDAAYAEARRAREEAARAKKEAEDLKRVIAARAAEEARQKELSSEKDEDARFEAQLQQTVAAMREQGLHEGVIEARVEAMLARYEAAKLRKEAAREKESLKREREKERLEKQEEAKRRANEKAFGFWHDQFKELRRDYPDLLPKKAANFEEVVAAYPKIIEHMIKEDLNFKRAFKELYEDEVAERRYKRKKEKENDNADRSTSSGKEKGDPAGGTYGLNDKQQALAKEGGMTNKEYAALLKQIKK